MATANSTTDSSNTANAFGGAGGAGGAGAPGFSDGSGGKGGMATAIATTTTPDASAPVPRRPLPAAAPAVQAALAL